MKDAPDSIDESIVSPGDEGEKRASSKCKVVGGELPVWKWSEKPKGVWNPGVLGFSGSSGGALVAGTL